MGSGWVGLHVKGVLTRKSVTISRHWLALGGTVPPGSARCQSISITKNKET